VADPESQSSTKALGQIWQMPALLLGIALLVVGWLAARPEPPGRDYAAEISAARQYIAAERFDEATQGLNAVMPAYDQLEDPVKIQYHLAWGDAVVHAQRTHGWSKPENHHLIVEHYRAADELGHQLDDQRLTWLSESLIALEKHDEASEVASSPKIESPEARQELRRNALSASLGADGSTDSVVRALRQFLAEPDLARKHRIWAVARLGEAAIARGEHGEAADLIMRWLQRLDFANADDVGELLIVLGRAQLELGQRQAAERWFVQAQPMLDPGDPLQGDALAGLGRIRFQEEVITEAHEYFSDAAANYPASNLFVQTLIGKAECEARLGWLDQSLTTYDQAVEAVGEGRGGADAHDALAVSIREQREWRLAQGEYATALEYLKREQNLASPENPPALNLKMAMAHERIAAQMLGEADDSRTHARRLQALPQSKRIEVADHLEKAGEFYHAHAQQVAQNQPDQYGQSLWSAADCFDRSGLHDRAIKVFEQYREQRPDDPLQLQVSFRLAQAYQAEADFNTAIDLYGELQKKHPKSPEAYASLVPLARCYLAKGLDYWDQAEHVLLKVVTDHPALRPESRAYQEALIELGRLYYRRGSVGDYERAIERLSEAVARYGDDAGLPDMLFQLGDAYRKSVIQINQRLREPLPPSERSAFAAERASRLAEAQKAFDRVIKLYEARDDELTELQAVYLRNSYFYRADCAYDLGRFQGPGGAIELYQLAAKRYEHDPAALIAQIQIVNSYCELGEYQNARAANNKAKWMLERIDDQAFEDPNLPMTRAHWQRWLDWTSELSLTESSASARP
jgi:tetratricopeptide (TPR) repeat protein